jgi:hypothetical protein
MTCMRPAARSSAASMSITPAGRVQVARNRRLRGVAGPGRASKSPRAAVVVPWHRPSLLPPPTMGPEQRFRIDWDATIVPATAPVRAAG